MPVPPLPVEIAQLTQEDVDARLERLGARLNRLQVLLGRPVLPPQDVLNAVLGRQVYMIRWATVLGIAELEAALREE